MSPEWVRLVLWHSLRERYAGDGAE
jgi:hypothetical protein